MIGFVIGLAWVLGGYIIGSFPTGYVLVKLFQKKDIRTMGSGNIGATNVFRNAPPVVAASVFVVDMLKGLLPTLAAAHFQSSGVAMWVGVAAVIGHIFSVFMKFKGGKGVATTIGVYAGLYYPALIVASLIFGGVFYKSRIVSLSSLIAVFLVPFVVFVIHDTASVAFVLMLIAVAVMYAHRQNIVRLMQGVEPQLSSFGKQKSEPSKDNLKQS